MLQTNLFEFFTTYVLIFVVLNGLVIEVIDIPLLSLVALIAGFYVGHWNPGYYIVRLDQVDYKYTGLPADVLHIVIAVAAFCLYGGDDDSWIRTVTAILFMLLYAANIDIKSVYHTNSWIIIAVCTAVVLLWCSSKLGKHILYK